jgi:PAS domain S-box-containing protein
MIISFLHGVESKGQAMLKLFHGLKVSQKLMLISVFFMIPDTVLLCLFLFSINANIRFAEWERSGNEYQRPLESLLEHLPSHLLIARQSATDKRRPSAELAILEGHIDVILRTLEATDGRLGAQLQFTDEGLVKRKREHCRVQTLKVEWQNLKSNLATLGPAELTEQHLHLIADVRTMITHVGDTSNLILDPDLDSYYLMDVTLLALPQMQDRLATVTAFGEAALRRQTISKQERTQLAVYAALLKEADLDRIVSSTQTALNEDANFYGTSESLRRRIPPALQEFTSAAEKFIQQASRLGETERPEVAPEEFLAAGTQARAASFTLWKAANEELDALLDKRIDHYRARRARSLILTALALTAAVCFVTFITHSISGPLQRQAADLRQSNGALQAEVQERQRVEAALRTAEEKYRGIFENAVEGIFQSTAEGRYLVANPTLARIYGYESAAELEADLTDIGARLYVDSSRRAEFQRQVGQFGQVHRFESQAYRKDGSVIWISEHARAVRDASGALLYYEGTVEDITERKRNETELEKVHKELVEASRLAGMAEVATGVLHNVGNVLNSVNVSANFVTDKLRKSKLADLPKIAALLRENAADLGRFITSDPKGKQLPGYIGQLADHLTNEQETLVKKMDLLRQHLDHIKEIVAMQQSYAKVSGVTESIQITDLVEDALRLNAGALSRHQVEVRREYDTMLAILVDKHKVLQILVNLIRNAKYACDESGRVDKQLTLRTANDEGRVRIAVIDNGVGIPPENLIRIFNHGFTTRKDGHGFGLHSGALAAKEMGGSLHVRSDGPGRGATFTLELPTQLRKAA